MVQKSMLPLLPLVVALVAACESKTPEPEAAPPAATAQAETATATAAQPAIDLESVPAPQDFEQEAAAKVSADSLGATLDELEKEIEAD